MSDCTARGEVLAYKKFRIIKPEIRVLGVDDGIFKPRTRGCVPVIGVVFRGGYWLDGVMHTKIRVDGTDATRKIAQMITKSPHYKQLRVVMLDGITFAGFNVVDIKELNAKTRLPVITVTREKPNLEEIRRALKNLPKSEERWKAILNAGEPLEVPVKGGKEKIYMQAVGISLEDAIKILKLTSTRSNIPEALRVAHLIASGITSL
ncbi:MAG: DUF99 family protein [Candidatus Bathyarchaeia archaeon]